MPQECSVQVGVRIRPFNEQERSLGAQLCVDVDGPTTILRAPGSVNGAAAPATEAAAGGAKGKDGTKRFTFDASFWSHDGFVEEEGGYLKPAPDSRYADQKAVFDAFGQQVLDNAWEGYHCCLFAYGQTGSGKSYSMVGYGANKGIVPISCGEIFRRIGENTDENLKFEVVVSMIEIYNEQVQDLLMATRLRTKKGLEVHESKQLGIYLEGVTKRPVDSYRAIEKVLEEGTQNRTVGATMMNATSSRAHTILTIDFKQISSVGERQGCKASMINLVDLAGSEKVGQSGATGDRLKEGAAINKSLSALGNCIEKLADKATGKAKPGFIIPYRDSKLTRILQNALGGACKTIMICAISPAASHHEETLSTLRYADRAKRIKNAAVINENPQDKIIRQLREENARLKEMLAGEAPGQADAMESAALTAQQAEIAALENALAEMQQSFAERLKEAEAKVKKEEESREREKANLSLPHLANLNEDQLLTNKLQFAFKLGFTHIGRAKVSNDAEEEDPDVVLAGPGIQRRQATVVNTAGRCTLSAQGAGAGTSSVNGSTLATSKEGTIALAHGDRVVFGGCIFVFVDPAQGTAGQLLDSGQVSHAIARKELRGGLGVASEEELAANRKRAEELEFQVRQAEEVKIKAQADAEMLLAQREADYQTKLEVLQAEWDSKLKDSAEAQASGKAAKEEQARHHAEEVQRLQDEFEGKKRVAEEEAQRKIEELERQVANAAAEEENHKRHQLNMQRLEEQLMHVMPLVKEANLIAEELKQPRSFETKMQVDLDKGARGSVSVTTAVLQDGVPLYDWSPETLENRVFLMRELLQRCEDEGDEVVSGLKNEENPFWDPVKVERLIGMAQVLLEGLCDQLENTLDARILSNEGRQVGILRVEVWPVGSNGTPGIPDEELVEKPDDLLGTKMTVLVRVVCAADLPETLANDVRVEYEYFLSEKKYEVPPVSGHNCAPEFGYERTFVQDPVTSRFLDYLRTKTLVFYVYGRDSAAQRLSTAASEARTAELRTEAAAAQEDSAPATAATATVATAAAKEEDDGEPTCRSCGNTGIDFLGKRCACPFGKAAAETHEDAQPTQTPLLNKADHPDTGSKCCSLQ